MLKSPKSTLDLGHWPTWVVATFNPHSTSDPGMLLVMSELVLNVQNSCAALSLESLCGAKTLWYLRATQEPSSGQPSPFTEEEAEPGEHSGGCLGSLCLRHTTQPFLL